MKKMFVLVSAVSWILLAPTLHAQGMAVGGQLGLGLPMGDFGDSYSTGIGLCGIFHYEVQPNIRLTGTLGYYSFGVITNSFVTEGSLKTIPILVGARYNFGTGDFNSYAGAEIGIHMISATIKSVNILGSKESTNSETDFGFAPMIGFYYPLSSKMNLDVNLKFVFINGDLISYSHLGLNAGIMIPLE